MHPFCPSNSTPVMTALPPGRKSRSTSRANWVRSGIDNLATGKALYQYLNQAKLELVVIDPVFADEGKFYPNLDERHLALQKKLLQVADFATPNLTEAKFLTGQMQNTPDLTQLAREVERLLFKAVIKANVTICLVFM